VSDAPNLASARARLRQLEASNPEVSAFVAASAGSGKTKLLIDRLLRLMLNGADPARILCLTFTKAAAAEMALRLQSILGKWVTLDSDALSEALKELNVAPSPEAVKRARALFARVLDLPGGMRISTIHAFCQSLLRRFPLEAALAPHFRLLEDADGHAELLAAREDAMAQADPAALATIAGLVSDSGFGRLVAELRPHAATLAPLLARPEPARLAALQRAVGVSGDDAGLVQAAVQWPEEALRGAIAQLRKNGSASERELADRMFGWLNLPPALRIEHWGEWLDLLLTKTGEPRKAGAFCKSNWAKSDPGLAAACVAEAERAAAVEEQRRALQVATITAALLTLAAPVLAGFDRRKRLGALLDYDDLITRTSNLLLDPGTAWVLFKLDGGLDHLLLDEVQDTAAAQWRIAGALTAEFFAGEAAREGTRTVFAVGDRKQSIYSFQGADPAGFDEWRGKMRNDVTRSGGAFRDTALDVSFRSTSAVLALVDAVFADPVAANGVVQPGDTLRHEVHRDGQAGRVELWPLVPRPPEAAPEPWAVARRNHGLVTAPQRLADALAHWIAAQIGRAPLPSRGRCVAAGDILILVRRRDDFARALVRRLKGLGVPVAGLDRLYLTDQPAVQDLLALCDTLLLPDDDLSLACVLTSPLGELDDDDLMALAIGRDGSLWDALRRRASENPHWQRAATFIAALMSRVDFVAPHALLVEALGPRGARARLLRRLGPEAAEPIDELLGATLAYAAAHPPSLQGFLHWLRQSGAEVKREAEAGGRTVRVMTVHGAKGLQAPLVILPDTTSLPPDGGGLAWTGEGLPLWSPHATLRCAVVDRLRAEAREARMQEYNRLLYVALTRAEDRLVVCGWETRRELPDETWYATVRRGMQALSAEEVDLSGVGEPWDGAVLAHATDQRDPPSVATPAESQPPKPLPQWAGLPPDWIPGATPAEPPRPTPVAPSRPADAGLGPVPHSASPLLPGGGAMERGALIHRLLQHAPNLPRGGRDAAIAAYLAKTGASADLAAEVVGILDHPVLAPLFGPEGRAEQPLTGLVDGAIVSGLVDRLAVLPDRILLADYKTNREAPAAPDLVPVLYLRQMAAYRAILRQVLPGRPVQCSLVWTRTASVMLLPDAVLDGHAPGQA
jgi:ATP-dependent helicase/nuclease subunit A